MNMQQSPRKPAAEVAPYLEQIDRATEPAVRREPPTFGEASRGAIDSVITNLADSLSKRIGELRGILDEIEQHVLESAAQTKATLENHVAVCVRVDDEIRAMQIVVKDLKEDTHQK